MALVTITDEADLPKFGHVIASAFSNDTLHRYLYLGRDSHPDHPKLPQFDLRLEFWMPMIIRNFHNGGVLVQSCDWAAVAQWLPPGVKKPVASGAISEGAAEYHEKFGAMKKEHLGDRQYWYLNLVGRDPSRHDKGAIRALFEPFLQKARERNVAVWLEATNPHAVEVYRYFGFQVAGEVRIGQGVVNGEGWAEEGGDGLLLWGMILETS